MMGIFMRQALPGFFRQNQTISWPVTPVLQQIRGVEFALLAA
jgi:hypothetical protein